MGLTSCVKTDQTGAYIIFSSHTWCAINVKEKGLNTSFCPAAKFQIKPDIRLLSSCISFKHYSSQEIIYIFLSLVQVLKRDDFSSFSTFFFSQSKWNWKNYSCIFLTTPKRHLFNHRHSSLRNFFSMFRIVWCTFLFLPNCVCILFIYFLSLHYHIWRLYVQRQRFFYALLVPILNESIFYILISKLTVQLFFA